VKDAPPTELRFEHGFGVTLTVGFDANLLVQTIGQSDCRDECRHWAFLLIVAG
jgi:hypothetical protein